MKHTGKKILSLLLAVLMLVGLAVPTGILAPTAKAEGETTTVTVKVKWEEVNTPDDWTRPASLEFTLIGLPEGTSAPTPTINKGENEWIYTWEGLPKYDENGAEIVYMVAETKPDGYNLDPDYAVPSEGTILNTTRVIPDHSKNVTPNGDGTYTIELTVTGDADDEVETAANVNVLIVYDESSSMTSNNVTTNPNRNRADYAEDVIHDFIVGLRRYQKQDDPATANVNESENIQIALVGFGPSSTLRQGWTSNLQDNNNNSILRFFDDGVNGTTTSSHNYGSNNGTNWQAALNEALTLLNGNTTDGDPTFVILVTDGACTAASGETTIAPNNTRPWTDYRPYYAKATTNARSIQSRENTTLFGIYAYGTEADLLDDLIYYSNTGNHRSIDGYSISNATAAQYNFGATTTPTDNYFNAQDTAALNAAIQKIFSSIVEALGVSSVAISDGTTSEVETSTEVAAHLLDVDQTSYKYWLTVPIENNQFTRKINVSNNGVITATDVTYTVEDNGDGTCTVTWKETADGAEKEVTVTGTVSGTEFKYQWTEDNALYDKAPPAAKLVDGAVEWDLSSVGTLLHKVTYSITFDVWPSQTTLDYIADIKNDPDFYATLDENIRKYLDEDGNLATNTTTSLSYIDTREGDTLHESTFNPVEPRSTEAVESLLVSKKWENALDGQAAASIELTVLMDGSNKYPVTLGGPNWEESVFISVGIMHADEDGGNVELLTTGHNFTFKEPQDLGYYWELDVPTVRPMIINGTETTLILIDDKHPAPEGAKKYTIPDSDSIAGGEYYAADLDTAGLTATNHRRSRLNLTKVVDGEGADPDQTFPFTLNVSNSKAASGSANDLNSDYWVWFSIYNDGEPVFDRETDATAEERTVDKTDERVSGFTYDEATGIVTYRWNGGNLTTYKVKSIDGTKFTCYTGYYYAPSGSDIEVELKAGDNLRFLNLPTGSTYTLTEGNLSSYYKFVKAELTEKTWDEDGNEIDVEEPDESFSGDRTTTGTIQTTNIDYTVTYTNEYARVNVTVDKVWEDASNQDGIRPTQDKFALTLNGAPAGFTVPDPTVTTSTDRNTWTYTWKDLPKYDNDTEITYTVSENSVPTGYEVSGSPASNKGTITNTHTPATIDVTVTKVWEDDDNQYETRPDTLEVQLSADGEPYGDPVTLDADGNWSYTWTALPQYKDGAEIEYTADETEVPAGYEKTEPADEEAEEGEEGEEADDGTLTITITNTYSPEPTTVSFPVKKVVEIPTGLTGPDSWSFTFNVAAGDGAPAPSSATATVSNTNDTATFTFADNAFTAPGTYTYTVTETGTVDGVTNDSEATTGKTVTVTVTPNEDGTLTATASSTTGEPLTFTNTYSVEPTTASFPVKKVVEIPEGLTGPDSWSFTFNVAAAEDAPAPTSTTANVSNTSDTATFTFADGAFTAPGTYTYTVTETGTVAGVTNDADAAKGKTVTVTVTDNKDGTLIAEASSTTEKPLTFTNTYGVEPTTASFPVQKILSIPEGLTGPDSWSFTFNVAAAEGAPAPTSTTANVSNTSDTATFTFAADAFKAPGTYTYTVTETGELEGVTNDGAATTGKTVTVTVTDNKDGTLIAEASSTEKNPLAFTNTYGATGSVELEVTKAIEGAAWPSGKKLTINLTGSDGAPMPETTTVELTAADTAKFPAITYDEDDVGNKYTYTISEGDGFGKGWTGSGDVTATVEISDKGDGSLNITVTYTPTDKTITNTYKATGEAVLEVTKKLAGAGWPSGKTLTLTLTGEGGTLPETKTVTLTAEGKATFGAIKYTEADIDKEYTYIISEDGFGEGWTGSGDITATVKVSDNGDGTLTTDITYSADDTIINTYVAEGTAVLQAKKVLEGRDWLDGESFTFTLKDADGKTIETKTVTEGSASVTFTAIQYSEEDVGKTFTYTISETSELPFHVTKSADITATVEVTDAGGGKLAAEVTYSPENFTITNTYTSESTEISGTKTWDDGNDQDGIRPDSITVRLLANGKEVASKEVTAKDGWKYTFSDLPVYKSNGDKITYTITEDEVEGYTTTISGYDITNTYNPDEQTVTVNKIWNDNEDQDGKRPDSITVYLFVNGEKCDTQTLSESSDSPWAYTWEHLPKKQAGKDLTYTVEEDVSNLGDLYQAEEPVKSGSVFTITNTHEPEKLKPFTVTKVWNDDNNKTGKRPDSITVTLLANGKTAATATLTEADGWTHTFENLPKYEKGKEIEYTLKEATVSGYTSAVTGNTTDGFTVTNTVKDDTPPSPPPVIRIEIVKVWEDDSNASGTRTETVEVTLLKGGVKNLTRNLGDSNEWKYEGYVEAGYDYKVVETPVEGYESIVTQSPIPGGIRFTVVNKLTKTPELNTKDHVAYIVGYPDGTVRPGKEITRAEVATIFFRLLTEEARDKYWSQTNPYPDVKLDDWFNNAISTLTNMGIINGYEDGTFRPNNPITRAELTKMAVSFFSSADQYFGKTPSFSDVPADAWYTRFIAAAEALGLINGYPDGTFRPTNYITRAETCTIVNRTLGRGPHKDHLLPYAEMINWPDNTPDAWYYAQIQEASNSHDYDWITEQIENTTVEQWLAKLPERDWVALEQIWSNSHSAPGGEVMG